jgi:RHS repeat-associated protein
MNFPAPFKTLDLESAHKRCVQHPRLNAKRHAIVAYGALLFAFSAHNLSAQVGNQNPAGASGAFNGQVNTGCSYDPYTGNATRSVTDIAVAGAVGEYPLALVRTANSRAPSTTEVFGWAAGWNHNYNWILEDSPTSTTQNFQPKRYTVEFPDGRVETFRAVTWDSVYRVRSGADTPAQSTSAGVRERFLPLDTSTMYAYLILPDGGAVEFKAVRYTNVNHNRWWYKYHATAIYDPHGLKTQLLSSTTPSGLWRRLDWVIEPAGRWLHFTYTGPNNPKIASVEASDGRVVNYYYIYCTTCRLDRVRYYNNPAWDARYQYCNSNVGQGLPWLLWTADDPMYAGPMKRIGYVYRTANNPDGSTRVYGQIQSENYYDGTTVGAAVSTLAVGTDGVHTGPSYRKETRGDGATRTFVYGGAGYLYWASDFTSHQSTRGYDDKKYLNSYIDFNRHETNYTNDPITGNVTQIRYPLTQGDTPGQSQQPTVNYTYTNSYYLHTMQSENNFTTTFTRDGNHRVTRIDYPDSGYETFGYDSAHFYQLSSHRMTTGGTETFAYDGLHRKQYYSDPYHSNPGNPSIQYFYDDLGRVSRVSDALSHSTDFDYNDRGQLMVTTLPWYIGTRYTISNAYNADGTLRSKTDELGNLTSYTYDDYRRLKTVTLPVRGDGSGTHTTSFYYGANPWDGVADYRLTDANATYVVLPSGKKTKILYDDNRRKSTATIAPNTLDETTTSYGYDAMGNLTTVTNPRNYVTTTVYDQRNRSSSVTFGGQTTTFQYDTAGHRKTITRPNGQVITYASFDEMNRVLQQNVTQTPDPLAVTKFTYYPSGLLNTMQDPHLSSGSDNYTYAYDLMGRKQRVTYPLDSTNVHRTEQWSYDEIGRLYQFTNRGGKVQTFTYDQLSRMSGFTWNDGITPGVSFGYDEVSRVVEIDNANAHVSRSYFNDDLLHTETQDLTPIGGVSRTITYGYDDDANRGTLQIPGYTFDYTYTGRNQIKNIKNGATALATYNYDENNYAGDLTSRVLNNGTRTDYLYDPLDRVTWITHTLNGTSRGFNYGYQDNSNNQKYVMRTGALGNLGDVFNYDLADQIVGVQLNVQTPQSTPTPTPNISYDPNGNRTTFRPYGSYETYTVNDLSAYTSRTILRTTTNAAYDNKGNLTTGFDGSTYVYDAQNRLTSATKSGVNMSFTYDGLNRQVSRTVGGSTKYSTWEGWDLIEEYHGNGVADARYLYGPTGLVKNLISGNYYYQDGSGSTSHLASSNGTLLEWYRYDLQGTPVFYDVNNNQLSASALGVRHLFTGQQWYSQISLYDLRNRFYSPDIGRFLQPDPIGFDGDASNLYRYSANNPVASSDPMGLDAVPHSGGYYTYVAYWPWNRLLGMHIVNGSEWLQCAGAARFLGGGYINGVYYNMPKTRYWYQGAMLSRATAPGTVVATNWGPDGGYPSESIDEATRLGHAINHTLVFAYWDKDDNAHLFSQNPEGPIYETKVNEDDAWQYNEVNVDKSSGPYESTPSTRSIAEGNGASSHTGVNTRVPSIIGGIFYPYGFGNMSPNMNFAGGRAGTIQGAFTWGQIGDGSTPNFALPYGGDIAVGGEPPECFVAGTLILMADGSEKSIESVAVGEEVLAWNEDTKKVFPSKVVAALHHEERLETLFDIELEDGRKFTVNNTHPMYVVEDNDFKFTDDLAARFAKGESVTFQDSNEGPVKVASLRMRKEICKMYNLHVEGQGKNGHTYYANGILVHNFGVGFRRK